MLDETELRFTSEDLKSNTLDETELRFTSEDLKSNLEENMS